MRKLFPKILLCWNIALIDIKLKKYEIKPLMIFYQRSYLFPIGLLQVRWLKNFIMLYSQMMKYSFLMKILVMSLF